MEHTSQVLIAAEPTGPIRLQVLGCLTLETAAAVTQILDRGAAFVSCPDLVVDLRSMEHIDPVGLAAFELYIDQHRAAAGLPRVPISLPTFPCECQEVAACTA